MSDTAWYVVVIVVVEVVVCSMKLRKVSKNQIEVLNFLPTKTCVKCVHHCKLVIKITSLCSNSCTLST